VPPLSCETLPSCFGIADFRGGLHRYKRCAI
jgi:hypothetical protein